MPETVVRKIGPHNVALTFDTSGEATQFADAAVAAIREAQVKVSAAHKLTCDAFAALGQRGLAGLNAEFQELLRLYFRLPVSATPKDSIFYKEAICRITSCLQVVKAGLLADGVKFGQLAQGECGSTKGLVPATPAEGISTWVSSESKPFAERGALAADMLIDFRLLGSSYPLIVNTIIHEATHKFARTWDYTYFGKGGRKINADDAWYQKAAFLVNMEDPTNNQVLALPSQTRTHDQALLILRQAMRTSNNKAEASKKLTETALETKFRQATQSLDQQAVTAGLSAFGQGPEERSMLSKLFDEKVLFTKRVGNLTPSNALNNADSYSCFVYEMPDVVLT